MNPSRAKPFRPAVEALENRTNMSSTVSASGVLTILGGPETTNDTVFVTENLDADTIRVSQQLNDQPALVQIFPRQDITGIQASLGSGNDRFSYLVDGSDFTDERSLLVDLGPGNDTAAFDLANDGAGSLVELHEVGIAVYGGAGRDRIKAAFGQIERPVRAPQVIPPAALSFHAEPGLGNDTVAIKFAGDIRDHAVVDVEVYEANDLTAGHIILARGGNDSITVSGNVDIRGALDVVLSGASGADRIQLNYQGKLDTGDLYAELHGGAATDLVRADITLDAGSTGYLGVILEGEEATNDSVLLLLTDNSDHGVDIWQAEVLQDFFTW